MKTKSNHGGAGRNEENEMQTTERRGGAGRGQGVKPADGKRGKRTNIVIDSASAEVFRDYAERLKGIRDLSLGIRLGSVLVEEAMADSCGDDPD